MIEIDPSHHSTPEISRTAAQNVTHRWRRLPALISALAAGLFPGSIPSVLLAQPDHYYPHSAYLDEVQAHCGHDVRVLDDTWNDVDAADSSGKYAELLILLDADISAASRCLVRLPASIHSEVRVYLRNEMLVAIVYENDAMREGAQTDARLALLFEEVNLSAAQCTELDLMSSAQPFSQARALIRFELQRFSRVRAFDGNPIERHRRALRKCAKRLDAARPASLFKAAGTLAPLFR